MVKLGILAGRGSFPNIVADAAATKYKGDIFVIAYAGLTGKEVRRFPHAEFSLLEVNSIIKRLKKEGCKRLVIIGGVDRLVSSSQSASESLIADIPAQLLVYAQEEMSKQHQSSDDSIMTALVRYLEEVEDFEIVGAEKIAPSLMVKKGLLVGEMNDENKKDIVLARRVARGLGELSIGQSAVICRLVVLAVEAAEGTDKMLERIKELPQALWGDKSARSGVLIKLPRPHQDLRIDMPAIGVETVKHVANANLAGIVVRAGHILIDNREAVIAQAKKEDLFIQAIE